VQSKNEVIRRQEDAVKDLRDRVADLTRQVNSRDDSLVLGERQRELLERELKEARKNVAEGAELVQRNEEVINHLNEMLNSFQLGGSGWTPSTPFASSKRPPAPAPSSASGAGTGGGGYMGQGGHFVFEDSLVAEGSPVLPLSGKSGAGGRGREDSPHLNSSALTDREESPYQSSQRGERGGGGLKHKYAHLDSSVDRSKSVVDGAGLNLGPLAGQVGDRRQSKGYYDGLLDIPFSSTPTTKTRISERHSSTSARHTRTTATSVPAAFDSPVGRDSSSPFPSHNHTPGITQLAPRSGKKPIYSWQLDDFGRSDEVKD
jgi:hypothetical protein